MGSGNSGRQQEDALKTRAETLSAKAAEANPIEQRQQEHTLALDDFFSGKSGPIDIRNLPYGGAAISAYNDARRAHDAGRISGGMGTMTDANPNFTAAVDKENQLERDQAASGALEGYVTNTQNQVYDRMTGLSTAE
ncbi:MAG TPA: hypothetical protein VE713_08495, partial [Pyrinomonadaceae bacterium]|nr:hypothetical protein [Pyrinomonadaceae bacterium]